MKWIFHLYGCCGTLTHEMDPRVPVLRQLQLRWETGRSSEASIADWRTEPPKAPEAPFSVHEWLILSPNRLFCHER